MSTNIPFHETGAQQSYGISPDCLYNDHPMCRSPRCGCSCHKQAVTREAITSPIQTGMDKYCPKCKVKAPSEQNFCRVDGAKLSSLRCPECGTPGDQTDNYCGYCGCSMKVDDKKLEDAAMDIDAALTDDEIFVTDDPEAAMRAALDAAATNKSSLSPANPSKVSPRMFK